MVRVLDMQFIRYANLFNRITHLTTNHCFEYNHTIIFVAINPVFTFFQNKHQFNLLKKKFLRNIDVNFKKKIHDKLYKAPLCCYIR